MQNIESAICDWARELAGARDLSADSGALQPGRVCPSSLKKNLAPLARRFSFYLYL